MKNKKFDFKKLAILGMASGAILISQAGEAASTINNNQFLAAHGCGAGSCGATPSTNARTPQENQRNQGKTNPHAEPSYPANYSQNSFQYKNNNLTALNDPTATTENASLSDKTKIAPSKSISSKTHTTNRQNLSKRTQSQKLNNRNPNQRPLALAEDSSIDSFQKSAPNGGINTQKDLNNRNVWDKNAKPSYPRPATTNKNYNSYKDSDLDDDNDDDSDDDSDDDFDDADTVNSVKKANVRNNVPMPASKINQPSYQKNSFSRNSTRDSLQRQTAMNDDDEDSEDDSYDKNGNNYREQRNIRSKSLYNRNSYRNSSR